MQYAGQVAEPLTPMVAEPLTFPQRMMQVIRPGQQPAGRPGPPPPRRAGKLIPGKPLPHIVLNTVQVGVLSTACFMHTKTHECYPMLRNSISMGIPENHICVYSLRQTN